MRKTLFLKIQRKFDFKIHQTLSFKNWTNNMDLPLLNMVCLQKTWQKQFYTVHNVFLKKNDPRIVGMFINENKCKIHCFHEFCKKERKYEPFEGKEIWTFWKRNSIKASSKYFFWKRKTRRPWKNLISKLRRVFWSNLEKKKRVSKTWLFDIFIFEYPKKNSKKLYAFWFVFLLSMKSEWGLRAGIFFFFEMNVERPSNGFVFFFIGGFTHLYTSLRL